MRRSAACLLILLLIAGGSLACGKYGPPERPDRTEQSEGSS